MTSKLNTYVEIHLSAPLLISSLTMITSTLLPDSQTRRLRRICSIHSCPCISARNNAETIAPLSRGVQTSTWRRSDHHGVPREVAAFSSPLHHFAYPDLQFHLPGEQCVRSPLLPWPETICPTQLPHRSRTTLSQPTSGFRDAQLPPGPQTRDGRLSGPRLAGCALRFMGSR